MRLPVQRERIYRVLVTHREISVAELARTAGVTRQYAYKVVNTLAKRAVAALNAGRVRLIDRKGLVIIWGMEKREIIRKYGVKLHFRPREIIDLVLFSGTAALWVLGKVLYPTMGTIYVTSEKLDKLMEHKRPDGYGFRVLIDNDVFNYTIKLRGRFRGPIVEQIAADAIAEGLFGKEALEYIED